MSRIDILQSVLYFFEILACITGFIYWKKVRHTYWKWFPVYLAIIVVIELGCKYIIAVGVYPTRPENVALNLSIYKYFGIPIQFIFFFWLFSNYLKNYKERNWPLIGTVIYILSWLADLLYFNNLQLPFSSFSYTIGNIILAVLILLFFVKFMNSQDILLYKQSMMFWVCLGLLIFYLGTLPLFGMRNTLINQYMSIFLTYYYISFIFNYIMYFLFAIAFIWGKPK